MSQKTKDITESQWLALVDSEVERELRPPANSKTIEQLQKLWKYSIHHTRFVIKQRMQQGRAKQTRVGARAYYTLQ